MLTTLELKFKTELRKNNKKTLSFVGKIQYLENKSKRIFGKPQGYNGERA